MNIFVLDWDVRKCAQYHNDKHVVKMILETAQLLCGVLTQEQSDELLKQFKDEKIQLHKSI